MASRFVCVINNAKTERDKIQLWRVIDEYYSRI